MAWTRNVLRVNLSAGTCTPEPLNMTWARDFLGQRGLATKYLVSEIDPKIDPFSPENKLIFVTGPLTGTMAATGGRYSVVTKGPLTGAIACSNSGGYFGAELKFAGWDMVIIEGASPKPVYLLITDDEAELVDAAHLWGKTVWETEETIKKFHQDPQIRVAAIGRAGENRVLYAAIVNDLHRAAGRSGVGAVMGSKNLKAVAVRGTRTDAFQLADPEAFLTATEAGKKALAANGVTGQGLPAFGTQVLMNVINELGALPTRNHRDVQFEGAHAISGEAMKQKRPTDGKANLVTNGACFGCTIACGSAEALVALAELTARGEGFGKEIGLGSKRLCAKYGRPELSMTVKGQEFPAYDSRGIQGMGLTYATSNRGACHLRSYTVASEVLGIPVKTDPLATEGKPALVKAFQDATAVFDAAGICIFTSFAWTLADVQPQLAAACSA